MINFFSQYYIDINSLILIFILFIILIHPRIAQSDFWRATVTPFASIIGSGFLIVAPFMWLLVGNNGVWFMLFILIIAYSIGSVIRYNIKYSEPLSEDKENYAVVRLQVISDFTLSLAYFISIVFYLKLLSAFALKGLGIESDFYSNIITTTIILSTGVYGKIRGFDYLESLEVYSVAIKLCIILGFIYALLLYDIEVTKFKYHHLTNFSLDLDTIKKLAGMFLVIQGFETSRYLGHKYDPEMRIHTMRFAQIFSGLIYLSFIYLSAFLMKDQVSVTETEIIDITHQISDILPYVLVLAAMASQYSSSIADMIGCGTIINEIFNKKVSLNNSYLIIALMGLLLIWLANIFELVAYASRAFALYYFLQCIIALYVTHVKNTKGGLPFKLFIGLMGTIMMFIFIFGEPIHGG